MRLLKQIPSGDIYPWTEALAARSDMVELGNEPVIPEPVSGLESDEQPIQLQADPVPAGTPLVNDAGEVIGVADGNPEQGPPAEEIPTENSESASAEDLPPLDDAIESFRRQASKSAKKAAAQDNG